MPLHKEGWRPVGSGQASFTGRLDGQSYEIRDLFIDRPDELEVGLVGRVADIGVVDNVGVVNSEVTGNWQVGGLVGLNWDTVRSSYSSGRVTGNEYVGGLVGDNWGTVSKSFWDKETSGMDESAGGTGKTTTQMIDVATFTAATWRITPVAPDETDPAYTWNILDGQTYPFLSWQSIS